jgi:phosphoglycerate dehydrogenase-like enzyme
MAGRKLKVFVDNTTIKAYPGGLWDFFVVTPEIFESAGAKFPGLRSKIDVEFGSDFEALDKGLETADILISWEFPRKDLAKRAPKLRWIFTVGAGIDHLLPLDWLPPNVTLTHASGSHRPAAEETIMASILMLNSRFVDMMTNQRKKHYQYLYRSVVRGKTLLMVGVGQMGTAAAEVGKSLGMKTIGVRPSKRPHPSIDEMYGPEDLLGVLPRADFVVVTVPKTPENVGFIGRRELEHFKRGAYLINFGRYEIVDYNALIDLLEKGHIASAVCDLDDPKGVKWDERLWNTPNLFIIPHSANNDPQAYSPTCMRIFYEELERFVATKPLAFAVNRKLGY